MTLDPDSPPDERYALRFENRPGYLFARVSGPDDSYEITLSYWLRIADECRARSTRQLLVVDELSGQPATLDELERLVDALVGLGFEGMRVAFVEPHHERVALVEHAEIKARDMGYVVRVFSDEIQAGLWLRHGERWALGAQD